MPVYVYRCPACGGFEMLAGRDDRYVKCACGLDAERRPFSGVPFLKGETMPRQIPDIEYRTAAEKRQLASTWGTAERSMEMIRASTRTDGAKESYEKTGFKHMDTKNMEALG
jgi:putative FmdB family regulatory protein